MNINKNRREFSLTFFITCVICIIIRTIWAEQKTQIIHYIKSARLVGTILHVSVGRKKRTVVKSARHSPDVKQKNREGVEATFEEIWRHPMAVNENTKTRFKKKINENARY